MTTKSSPIDLAREAPFALGNIKVLPPTREVVAVDGREVLEPKVMQVLVALYRGRGEVVSRDALIAHCWGGRVVGDDAINRCVGRIRRLSESHGGFLIETIPRVGHRLLESAPPAPPESVTPVSPAPVTPAPAAPLSRFGWLPATVGVVLIVLVGGLFYWRSSVTAPPSTAQSVTVQAPQRLSIAVLAFSPLDNNPGGQNLGDSIGVAVADLLSSGTRFEIISPVKSFAFRGAAKAKAAQALQADFLVDGEVRHSNDAITVSVRLIDGRDGTTLRASTVTRPRDAADGLPDLIATRVASYGWVAAAGFSRNARWDQKVMAGHLRLTGGIETGDPGTAYEVSRRMAAAAPDDAFAQHEHGVVISYLWNRVPVNSKAQLLAEMRAAEERAIRLDPEYGDPYIVLQVGTPFIAWAERERLLRKCLEMAPESTYGQFALLRFLHDAGRFRDAEPLVEQAFLRAPYEDALAIWAVNSRVWAGHAAQARPLAQRATKVFLSVGIYFARMFEATAFNGDIPAAEQLLKNPDAQKAFAPQTPPALYGLMTKALRSRHPADIAVVRKSCERIADRPGDIKQTCLIGLAALGQRDDAFRLAAVLYPDQRGATPEERERRWLASDYVPPTYLFVPAAASLRADPRFIAIVERIGLLAYWKAGHITPDFCLSEKAPVCALLRS